MCEKNVSSRLNTVLLDHFFCEKQDPKQSAKEHNFVSTHTHTPKVLHQTNSFKTWRDSLTYECDLFTIECDIMSRDDLLAVVQKGQYYNPATDHHSDGVSCDSCERDALVVCIGYKKWDVCLPCAERIANASVDKTTGAATQEPLRVRMRPSMFERKSESPDTAEPLSHPGHQTQRMLTRMEPSMFRPPQTVPTKMKQNKMSSSTTRMRQEMFETHTRMRQEMFGTNRVTSAATVNAAASSIASGFFSSGTSARGASWRQEQTSPSSSSSNTTNANTAGSMID